MTLAIIDCGTNTFHLLISRIDSSGVIETLYKTKAVAKLGEGGITRRIITPEPYQRGLDILGSFRDTINKWKVDKVIAYGTAALRNAKNGKAFIADAERLHGISLQLITGNREAGLIYKGVQLAMPALEGVSLIMDIGGGSTEFILGNEKGVLWKQSFRLGAALLLELFPTADPIKAEEAENIKSYFKKVLQPLFDACMLYNPVRLIGSSGSFDSFAEMILYRTTNSKDALKGKTSYLFNMEEYRHIHLVILQSTFAERLEMKGLVKMRADMIVMATLQLTFILDALKLKELWLSKYALKEGMLAEAVKAK